MTFRQQLGFGVHVLVMMGTFYALGHYAASHVSRNVAHVGALAGPTQLSLCGHKPCTQSLHIRLLQRRTCGRPGRPNK